ncbi:hypothetical protein JHK82_057002 [Glycine max]|nr:hypothetical protein JHK82_057002 [Glycine max]
MVKFSKELEAQLIPEWKEAFVNYWQLKKQIKRIKLSRLPKQSHHHAKPDFGLSIFDSLSFFVKNIAQNFSTSDHHDLNIIQVRKKTTKGDEEEIYETELAQLFSEEDEIRVFFMRLDEELNKVNQFYRRQESEFIERGETLNKQLQILLDLKRIISDRRRKNSPSKPYSTGISPQYSPTRDSNYSGNFGDSDETNSEISHTDEVITTLERNGISFVNSATRTKTKKGKPKTAMRIDVPATNPTRPITAITSMLWEDLVNNPTGDFLHKRKLQCAEKIIRSAFVELYKGLGLLKTYSSLNMVAFTKILKKFDKVSCQKASANYLKEVKRSHFVSSDKAFGLMDEVESIFTKHFANNDRKKAMKFLRPQQHKDSHMVTFLFALKHRDAFLISTTLMTTVIGAMVIHLLLRAANFSPTEIDAIPGILLLIPLLRHLETAGCHIFARAFKTHHPDTCHSGRCARRWFDDGDVNHLANMGKYVSAMVAAGARVTYSRQNDHLWLENEHLNNVGHYRAVKTVPLPFREVDSD